MRKRFGSALLYNLISGNRNVLPKSTTARRPRRFFLCTLLLVAVAVGPLHAVSTNASKANTDRGPVIEALAAAKHVVLGNRLPLSSWESAERFYASAGFAPVWFDAALPRRQAMQALDILADAASHGLDPADYDINGVSQRLSSMSAGQLASPQDIAASDVALTLSFFHYLSDLHIGRVDPHDVHVDIDLAEKHIDLPSLVHDALTADRIRETVARVAPALPMYERLRQALARYRRLAEDDTLRPLPVVKKVEPGTSYTGLAELRNLLVALGDSPATAVQPARYEGQIVDAVKRFQLRHGLDADGVIGQSTFEQLNVPMGQRVRQIELALERMRWIPTLTSDKVIAVNIPEFRLRAFDLGNGAPQARLSMNVIVGRALNTQTPVFDEDMRYIEFSPYWNVPPSIARGELIPKLRRDPGYLGREGMEFISTAGDGRVTTVVSAANLDALARGELRLRQRPGPKNALGDIKFVFPNNMNIYLHHTPTPQLFKRSRRDFSHGCIRVEEPVELAKFVLEDQPEWTEQRIREAMAAGKPSTVRLAKPIPVIIFYTTALVVGDGRILFLPDVYGHDRTLNRALRSREAMPHQARMRAASRNGGAAVQSP